MDNKIQFFDQTFRLLVVLAGCAWAIYAMLLIFAGDSNGCAADVSTLFTVSALAAGIFTAPPIIYGLARLLFWPNGPKTNMLGVAGWVLSVGAGIFITVVILFSLAISQYGCQ